MASVVIRMLTFTVAIAYSANLTTCLTTRPDRVTVSLFKFVETVSYSFVYAVCLRVNNKNADLNLSIDAVVLLPDF